MTIDAFAAHRILVATLVLLTRGLQQLHALGRLRKKNTGLKWDLNSFQDQSHLHRD